MSCPALTAACCAWWFDSRAGHSGPRRCCPSWTRWSQPSCDWFLHESAGLDECFFIGKYFGQQSRIKLLVHQFAPAACRGSAYYRACREGQSLGSPVAVADLNSGFTEQVGFDWQTSESVPQLESHWASMCCSKCGREYSIGPVRLDSKDWSVAAGTQANVSQTPYHP